MTDASPMSRPFSARHLGAVAKTVAITPTDGERAAVAAALGLAGIDALRSELVLTGDPERVHVAGRVDAEVVYICVVSLDPFPARVRAPVDATFVAGIDDPNEGAQVGSEFEADLDAPDVMANGVIDLGDVVTEFLALALDPYPRKPGAELPEDPGASADGSPFAALAALRPAGD